MTRINCIPVEDLLDQHLFAEYRELPRIFPLAQKWVGAGRPGKIPSTYRMGTGHVRFFYPRTGWLAERHALLVAECLRRGFNLSADGRRQLTPVPGAAGTWSPTPRDVECNLERLRDKVREKHVTHPTFYRHLGSPVAPTFYAGVSA